MSSRIVYSTETRFPTNRAIDYRLCPHGKDAGQDCYPCDVVDTEWLDKHYSGGPGEDLDYWNETDAQWNDVDKGDIHYASFDCV